MGAPIFRQRNYFGVWNSKIRRYNQKRKSDDGWMYGANMKVRRRPKYRFSPITSEEHNQLKIWRYVRLQCANAEFFGRLKLCIGCKIVEMPWFYWFSGFREIWVKFAKMWVKLEDLLLRISASYGSADWLCVFLVVLWLFQRIKRWFKTLAILSSWASCKQCKSTSKTQLTSCNSSCVFTKPVTLVLILYTACRGYYRNRNLPLCLFLFLEKEGWAKFTNSWSTDSNCNKSWSFSLDGFKFWFE